MYRGLVFSWNNKQTDHRIYTQPDSSLKPVGNISGVLPEEARRKFSSPAFSPPQTPLNVPHWPHSLDR